MKRLIFSYFCTFKVLALSFMPIPLCSAEIEKNEQIICPLSDKSILENFFHDLFSNSCAGYVIYGSKPVYLSNVRSEQSACIGTKRHKDITEVWEVLSIWKGLNLGKNQTDYFLHTSDPSTNPLSVENEFLLINRQAFIEAVNKNLLLFQYKFGVNVTAQALLNRLLDPKENISSLFKGNTALLGIILGYGTKNALTYERGTSIIKPALANELLPPPYRSGLPAVSTDDVIAKCKASNALPGFGYNSLSDEVEDLSSSIARPTDNYAGKSTKIAFSYHENSDESKQLIKMYENAQAKLEKAVSSKNFLQDTLAKFNSKLAPAKKEAYSFTDDQIAKTLPKLVTQSIWENFSEIDQTNENDSSLDHFISGMKEAEKIDSYSKDTLEAYDDVIFFDSYQLQLSAYPQIKKNLASAKAFFKTISDQSDITCIEPFKIYQKSVKKGSGESISNKTKKVSIYYMIKDIEDKTLSGSYKLSPAQTFEIAKLMPGLAFGLQGMKKNEIRDVFIHQDFAYGIHSDFGAGKALSVRVELVDMESSPEEIKLPELISMDLFRLQPDKDISKSQFEVLQAKYMAFCGFRTWMHFKKASNFFTLEDIVNSLSKMQNNPQLAPLFSEFDKKVLRRLNLFLYSKPSLILSENEND